MRFYLKLAVIVCLAAACQTTYEVVKTVQNYPADENCVVFYAADSNAVSAAEERFASCNWLTRWVVADVISMPLAQSSGVRLIK